jgi:hypothetical protein
MELQPISQHAPPAYPTRREFLASGAALLLAAQSGCGRVAGVRPTVAPIFAHGEGRGASGCIVMNPPVFLSEEEALQILREELAQAGIHLGAGRSLNEVTVEVPQPQFFRPQGEWLGAPREVATDKASLAAVDPQKKVGIEFVSSQDCSRFSGRVISSVQLYETKDLAQRIADAIRSQGEADLSIGLFYDPMTKENAAEETSPAAPGPVPAEPKETTPEDLMSMWRRRWALQRKRSEKLLRQQAQDFLAWLEQHPRDG